MHLLSFFIALSKFLLVALTSGLCLLDVRTFSHGWSLLVSGRTVDSIWAFCFGKRQAEASIMVNGYGL